MAMIHVGSISSDISTSKTTTYLQLVEKEPTRKVASEN